MIEAYGLSLVTAPAYEPVTATEVKAHCRISTSADDTLIGVQIKACREYVERFLHRRLVNSTWDLKLDRFPCQFEVPYPPLASVTHIKYLDTGGTEQTLAASVYTVDAARIVGRIVPAYAQVWPATQDVINAVTVRYVAGYGADSTYVPDAIRHAMLLILGHWYRNREQVSDKPMQEIPKAAEDLLWAYRVVRP